MSIILIKAIQLILALMILVTIHELGHFLFAKLFKIRVDKFYLFFDPWFSIFKYKPKGSDTEYGIGWLPLGGYCKIAGMVDESMDTDGLEREPEEWEFRAKPAWQRLLVMFGGVLFNVILAVIIYSGISYAWGDTKIPMSNLGNNLTYSMIGHDMGLKDGDLPVSVDGKTIKYYDDQVLGTIVDGHTLVVNRNNEPTTIEIPSDLMKNIIASKQPLFALNIPAVISETIKGSESQKAGLQGEDVIVGINDTPVKDLSAVVTAIGAARGDSATIQIQRNAEMLSIKTYVDANKGLGVQFESPQKIFGTEKVHYNLVQSVPAGVDHAYDKLTAYVSSLKYVATKEGVSQLGGLGTIGSLFPQTFDWYAFWTMTAFLSIILAVMNILPIPGLDGGHILFLLIEMITKKKPSLKAQERIQIVGMFFLLALMIYANLNDVFRFLL